MSKESQSPQVSKEETAEEKPFYRTIRSFVKREGKITTGQQNAIDELWPSLGVDLNEQHIDFNALFGREAPCIMEIGFGNGLSLADMAETAPENNFLGVEVHKPGVGSLLVQVKQRDLNNVRVCGDDVVELLKQIPNNSLNRVQIFFPDPWHKKRHHKRRLIQTEFVKQLVEKLSADGVIHVATDWQNYAEHVLEVLSENSKLRNLSNHDSGYSEKPSYRPETKYERRGIKLGHGVWDILFQKC